LIALALEEWWRLQPLLEWACAVKVAEEATEMTEETTEVGSGSSHSSYTTVGSTSRVTAALTAVMARAA
jgi:hypothetical protein